MRHHRQVSPILRANRRHSRLRAVRVPRIQLRGIAVHVNVLDSDQFVLGQMFEHLRFAIGKAAWKNSSTCLFTYDVYALYFRINVNKVSKNLLIVSINSLGLSRNIRKREFYSTSRFTIRDPIFLIKNPIRWDWSLTWIAAFQNKRISLI